MRIAALIMGILGGLASGMLGMKWISDYNDAKALIESIGSMGVDMGEINAMHTAGFILLAGLVAGIAGGILAFVGKGKLGAPLLLAFAILPAFFAAKSLVFTFLLIIAAVLAFMAKPKTA